GEVEAVLRDGRGAPGAVLVELETGLCEDDRLVEIALSDVQTRQDDDWLNLWDDRIDLVIDQPVDAIGELPDWRMSGVQGETRTASRWTPPVGKGPPRKRGLFLCRFACRSAGTGGRV